MAEISPDQFYKITDPLRGELVEGAIVRQALREEPFFAWIRDSLVDGRIPDAEIYCRAKETIRDRYLEWGDYDDYIDTMTALIAGQAIVARNRQLRDAKGDR